jgi:hypothetical protein
MQRSLCLPVWRCPFFLYAIEPHYGQRSLTIRANGSASRRGWFLANPNVDPHWSMTWGTRPPEPLPQAAFAELLLLWEHLTQGCSSKRREVNHDGLHHFLLP